MNWFMGVSFVGGLSYTKKLLESVGKFSAKVVIVDCAEDGPTNFGISTMSHPPTVIRPPVPLSHTQVHNLFNKIAVDRKLPWYMCAHNDVEASEAALTELVKRAAEQAGKWGILFTCYDCLAVYNTAAVRAVGLWDWRLFPSYYSDDDLHRRLKLAGYELVDTGIPVKHVGSHIINKVDKRLKFLTRVQFDHWAALYVEKWGDHPGKETFTKPFNGVLENPYPDE